MNRIFKIQTLAFAVMSMIALGSCEEQTPESPFQPEVVPGSFEYDGNTYAIRSVVVYELGNDTQLWISETAGYTTVEEIENSIGELVITIPNSKLGGQKLTFEQTGNFVRYDDKENSGFCMISCEIDKESKNISFEFTSQYLKSAVRNAISGRYEGPYSEYNESGISNAWAYNRTVADITSAKYIQMEDNSPSRFILYSGEEEAVDFTIDPESINKTVLVSTNNIPYGTSVHFDEGEEFKLQGSYGSIKVSIENDNMSVSLRLTNEGGKTLRAEYVGDFVKKAGNKFNRCVFESGSVTKENETKYGYDGRFSINNLSVNEGGDLTIRFNPGESEDGTLIDLNNIPTLRISRAMIDAGEIDLSKTSHEWSFTYHTFQLYSYDPARPESPKALDGSVLEVKKEANGSYTVNLELMYETTTFISQDKVDENGNVVTTLVPVYDSFGNPEYDKNGDILMKEVPVTEQVEIEIYPKIDIYYSEIQ